MMQPPVVGVAAIEVRTRSMDHDAYVLEEHWRERNAFLNEMS